MFLWYFSSDLILIYSCFSPKLLDTLQLHLRKNRYFEYKCKNEHLDYDQYSVLLFLNCLFHWSFTRDTILIMANNNTLKENNIIRIISQKIL